MLEIYLDTELVIDSSRHRFEMTVDDHTAFIEYAQTPYRITLIHTEVPGELAGKGVGPAIVEKTLGYIEGQNLKLIPQCPFVLAYIKRHPEWKRIVDPTFKGL